MLQAKNISYEITKDGFSLTLLDHVSFELSKNHFVAIVGPSGCGKTTLLKAIAGIQPETDGAFYWNGLELGPENDFPPGEVGYVPQFSIAYDVLTVEESIRDAAKLKIANLTFDESSEIVTRVLKQTGLENIANRKVKILSGGQKRRLALAIELVSKPHILLCDEVTSGLDPRSEREVVQLLHKLAREEDRLVISVTHSLQQIELYDSIMVLHQGHIVYHGAPQHLCHYFQVNSLEEIYPELEKQSAEKWASSWNKHGKAYYIGDKFKTFPSTIDTDQDQLTRPSFFSQYSTLLKRRFALFFKDKTQVMLQILMILIFPLLVALFSGKGQEPIYKLSAEKEANIIKEIEQQKLVNENQVLIGSAVSGIIMFQVILLGLMGSNNASREIAGDRPIIEKEKYAGVRIGALLSSKVTFLSLLVFVQSIWMFAFVNYFWPFRGSDPSYHFSFLLLANAAMTFICLGISSLSKTPEQSSLLSIYLVGFQLPLSGAVLALPYLPEIIIRPFISAYWAWSGSLDSLDKNVMNAVKIVSETDFCSQQWCYIVLAIHIVIGIILSYIGLSRKQWD